MNLLHKMCYSFQVMNEILVTLISTNQCWIQGGTAGANFPSKRKKEKGKNNIFQ